VASAPFARERVSQIFVPDAPAGARNVGSGYFVDARRVLTAAHVVGAVGSRARVRSLGQRDSVPADVSWRDEDHDLALLELTGDGVPGADWEPAVLGVVEGNDRIACRAVGFPDAQIHRRDEGQLVRDTEAIQGQIDPLTGVKAGSLLTVHIEGSVPKDPKDGQGTPWAGISGAALFCGPVLVGVLLIDPLNFERRLIARGLAEVARDPDLIAALGLADAPEPVPVRAAAPDRPMPPEPTLEAPLVRIPFARNPTFAGRTTLLNELEAAPAGQAQALVGMGGVGKSQLAIEYAYAKLDQLHLALVWWVRANDPAILVADLAELATQLGLAENETAHPEAADVALRWLRSARVPWLVIYDSALGPDDLGDHLAAGQAGRVVITSRRRGWQGLAHEVSVGVFDPGTATRFLLDASGRDDTEGAEALAERLGGLPLALSQAVAYLTQTGRSFADYLTQLERNADLLARPTGDAAYENTAAAVLAHSHAALQAAEPSAGKLLDLVAYLDSQRIPLTLLEESDDLPGLAPFELDRALSALRAYSLIEIQEGGCGVNRLAQEVTRARHVDRGPAHEAIALLQARFPADSNDPLTWSACAELLPHVLAAGEHTPDEADPGAKAWLLDRAATYIQYRGDASGATPLFERALALCRTVVGDEHPVTLTVLNNLAEALKAQRDLAGARELEERIVEIAGRIYGVEDPGTLQIMGNLAHTLAAQGDLIGARKLQKAIVQMSSTVFGKKHPNTLSSMGDLALTLRTQGDLCRARILQEHVLKARTAALGDSHPDTLRSMVNLATTLKRQGELTAARRLEQGALTELRRVLGEEHPDTLACMNNLAETRRWQGDLIGARNLLEGVLEVQRRVLSDQHPDILTTMNNLEEILDQLEEADGGDLQINGATRLD
jgi:Tetratricopeptide repeat/Trypsin-like peptidase domain